MGVCEGNVGVSTAHLWALPRLSHTRVWMGFISSHPVVLPDLWTRLIPPSSALPEAFSIMSVKSRQLNEPWGTPTFKAGLVPQRAPGHWSSCPPLDPPFAPPQLHPLVQIRLLLAPKTQDDDQEVQISRLQNGLTQTNGWCHNDYVHSLNTVYESRSAGSKYACSFW